MMRLFSLSGLVTIRPSALSCKESSHLNVGMPQVKHLGFFTLGIIAGLGLAVVTYHTVGLVGVIVSSAETVADLHIGWFPIRALVAYRAARLGGGWVYALYSRR